MVALGRDRFTEPPVEPGKALKLSSSVTAPIIQRAVAGSPGHGSGLRGGGVAGADLPARPLRVFMLKMCVRRASIQAPKAAWTAPMSVWSQSVRSR